MLRPGAWWCFVVMFVIANSSVLLRPSVADEETARDLDPFTQPSVRWILPPSGGDAGTADKAADMQKYTEKIAHTKLAFDMVPIPGGAFTMGSPEDEDGRSDDEGPQIEVKIDPFWMMSTEVTWDLYDYWREKMDIEQVARQKLEKTPRDKLADACARPTPAYCDMTFGMGSGGYPATCVTQFAAKSFCKWLTAKTGHYYRLPTEAEWEYACRAGTKTAYSFGDDAEKLGDYAWYFDNSPDGYAKVGQKKPNPWGLYDMHGNAAEWCLDQYIPDYYGKVREGKADDPFAVPTTLYPRVVRGGSWDDDAEKLRSAARRGSDRKWKEQDPQIPQSIWYHTDAQMVGFRVVRPLRMPTAEQAKLYEPDPAVLEEYNEAQGGKE